MERHLHRRLTSFCDLVTGPYEQASLSQRVLKLYDVAGLDRMTNHSRKKTRCTELCEAGMSIYVVTARAGQRHISVTAIYLTANIMRKAVGLT